MILLDLMTKKKISKSGVKWGPIFSIFSPDILAKSSLNKEVDFFELKLG